MRGGAMLLEHVQHPQGHPSDTGYSRQVGRGRRIPRERRSSSTVRLRRGSLRAWKFNAMATIASAYLGIIRRAIFIDFRKNHRVVIDPLHLPLYSILLFENQSRDKGATSNDE